MSMGKSSGSSSLKPSSSRLPPRPPLQTPPFNLPADWGVDEVARSDGSKSDKYYLEPGTGRRFRSLRDVERHLNGETVSRRRKSSELISPNNRPGGEILTSREECLESPPPSKVNWALANPQGDAWNPSIGDTLISDAVKREWRKRFVSAINNAEESSAVRAIQPQQPPQAAAAEENNIQQRQEEEEEEEGGLRRRSSRTKKLAYHHLDFIYI
ncbi:PREDICTED: methyl-CpG-binding domain-containing protein 6-like [Ipomoea nil]|uniref:methyl-CpG-binding domain-containing protein 6-like n=1 Tax=Ipomoea nil TaxID=35883 RepID=UPI000901B300|nr:PREDICTED: methyl-CpG-binding domain-containing protein 6-like [Ipomoea nil]